MPFAGYMVTWGALVASGGFLAAAEAPPSSLLWTWLLGGTAFLIYSVLSRRPEDAQD